MQRSVTKEGCKLSVNFPWRSVVVGRRCGWAGAISPISAPLPPLPKSSCQPRKARVLGPPPSLFFDWSKCPGLGRKLDAWELRGKKGGGGVTMPSRDELLASPEITSNLRHLRDYLVQPPHCPDWETEVLDCG